MIQARISEKRAAPWWAVIGAPLVGVPLMVAALALVAPQESQSVGEPETGFKTEQMDAQTADHTSELPAHDIEEPQTRL